MFDSPITKPCGQAKQSPCEYPFAHGDSKSPWAAKGQATPEAALETTLWAINKGDRNLFLACSPPGSDLSAEQLDHEQAKASGIVSFAIVSKETVSDGEVVLGVDLTLETGHKRARITMKKVEGRWRCFEDAQ